MGEFKRTAECVVYAERILRKYKMILREISCIEKFNSGI